MLIPKMQNLPFPQFPWEGRSALIFNAGGREPFRLISNVDPKNFKSLPTFGLIVYALPRNPKLDLF